jgi:hypothetical protein
MKIIYNEKMNELISKRKSNLLEIDNNLLEIDNSLDIYSDYYFYSNRIDRFFLNKSLSFIHYLNISILV